MLVICCGNPDRGDDAAGPLVASCLQAMGIEARIHCGEALSLMEAWSGAADVILVDAVVTGGPAGRITIWDANTALVKGQWFRRSTHAIGVAEAIGLARSLGRLPHRMRIFGIEGRRFQPGRPSPAVAKAVRVVAERIAQEMACTKLP